MNYSLTRDERVNGRRQHKGVVGHIREFAPHQKNRVAHFDEVA